MKHRDLSVSNLENFIGLEARLEWSRVQRLFEADPESAIASGEVLGPLAATGRENSNLVLLAGNTYFSRFRKGDLVDVARIDPLTKRFQTIAGSSISEIRFPAPGKLEVLIPGTLIPDNGTDLFLLPKNASGIKKVLQQKLLDLERTGTKAEHFLIDHSQLRKNLNQTTASLNSTQKEALLFLLDNDLQGLVQGPPGTGKTHLLVSLVKLAVESGVRVGLASLSHSAIDNALARILSEELSPDLVARVATSKERIKSEPYVKHGTEAPWISAFKEADEEVRLFAASMHAWSMASSLPKIDVLIIDEASQVPIYFYPFLQKICARVIMFGDHRQLPPVIQTVRHNLPADDIFSYQIRQDSYPMLEIQYRMNKDIQEWSSNRFYNGRLQPDSSNKERDILRGIVSPSGLLGDGAISLISHNGRASRGANQVEAKRVSELVWALRNEGKIGLNQIGIVTPHRAQAGAICGELQHRLGIQEAQEILVDTVERFQGQEREAMIFSIGVESEDRRESEREFLSDGRRLNVAVTRARSRFYCFAPERLMTNALFLPQENHLKSLLKWCQASDAKHITTPKNTA